jgi:uncharacterized membrane protein
MSLSIAEKNAINAVDVLMNLSRVRVTRRTLTDALQQHPDFPSMAAVSDVLTDLKINNLATGLTADRLTDIPVPALVHLQTDGGLFAPVRQITANRVEWLHTTKGWQMDTLTDFEQKWSGVTLLIEPDATSGERDYDRNRQREQIAGLRLPVVLLGLCVCIGLLLVSITQNLPIAANVGFYQLLLVKLAGLVISSALVWYGVDTQNGFLQKVCQVNSRSDCQNILNTPAAKLTDWLSWSEVGAFYFAGGFLATLVYGLGVSSARFDALPAVLLLLTCLSLPYTVWSVWYQARVARQWCVLCLAVQALLWAEFSVGAGGLPTLLRQLTENTTTDLLATLAVCYLLPIVGWVAAKPSLQKAMQTTTLFLEFQRLKFNPDYLSGLLSKQQALPPIFVGMKAITMGNPLADNTLLLVSNPTCATCRRTHLELVPLLETNPDIRVQIILAASTAPDDVAGQVARQILSLPPDQMADALHRWFMVGESRFAEWSRQTGGNSRDEAALQQQTLHMRWLALAGITAAPATFLNGAALPKFYQVPELPKLCAFSLPTDLAESR